MTCPRFRFSALLPSLLLVAAAGCSADGADGTDVDEGSADLTASNCELGTTCSHAIPLLRAVSFSSGATSSGRIRTDITIATTNGVHPRAVRQTTTGVLRLGDGAAVRLVGDARGEKGFAIDDNLLVEVLDTQGAVLAIATAGAGGLVRGGAAIPQLGPFIPSGSRPTHPQDLQLAFLLPKDRPFKLRLSLLDNGGPSAIGDVWLLSGPPAAPAVDPFDPASCTDAPLTPATAGPLFAPGATSRTLGKLTWSVRKQTCNAVSGCAPWQVASTSELFTMTTPIDGYRIDFTTVSLPLPVTADLTLQISGTGSDARATAQMATAPVHYAYGSESRDDGFETQCDLPVRAGVTPPLCRETLTHRREVNVGPQVLAVGPAPTGGYLPLFSGVVGKSCARLVQTRTIGGTTYELVAFGRY